MRWLIGIGWTLAAVGLIIAIWASAMDITAATEVPDPTYSYIAVTKTISVVSIDLVRVQILRFIAGVAIILLGAVLAAIGYLGLRLGLSPAPEPTAETIPASTWAPEPRPLPTPEQIAEASARDRREMKMLVICGAIFLLVIVILALIVNSFDQSATRPSANKSAAANTAVNAADPSINEVNADAANAVGAAERTVTAKPTPSATPRNDDDSGDGDEPEMPVPSATSPAADASLNSTQG
jgi:amino acid transporter